METKESVRKLFKENKAEFLSSIQSMIELRDTLIAEATSLQKEIVDGVNQVLATSQSNASIAKPEARQETEDREPVVTITRTAKSPIKQTARYLIDMFMKNGMTIPELSAAITAKGYEELGLCNVYATLKALGWVANKEQGGVGPFPYYKK